MLHGGTEGTSALDPGGFTLLSISSCTEGTGLWIQVSESSSLTVPKRWLLSFPVSSFSACYVHLVAEDEGQGVVVWLYRGAEQIQVFWVSSDVGWLWGLYRYTQWAPSARSRG